MYDVLSQLWNLHSLSYSLADGLAWDWINEKLYWADASTDQIEVYDPKTRNRKVLISTGSNSNPADIIVDPNNGYVFKHLMQKKNYSFSPQGGCIGLIMEHLIK